jgi:hypothetical protein
MKSIQRVNTSLQCPNCNGFNGYNYKELKATCKKCDRTFDVFDLFEQILTTRHDSNLWSFPFTLISAFGLAQVFDGILNDEDIKLRPFEQVDIDFRKAGLPEEAKILYVNISPVAEGTNPPLALAFAYLRGYDSSSIADLPAVIRIIPIPVGNSMEKSPDPLAHLNTAILIRWCLNNGNDIIADHVLRAAEAYWKNDLNQMIYNGFSAFELYLSNLIEDFWRKKKNLSGSEYKELLERGGVDKKMRIQMPLLCRELGVHYDEEVKRKFAVVDQLRQQRNLVVHSGKLHPNKEKNKGRLFASFCWGILFLKELKAKL